MKRYHKHYDITVIGSGPAGLSAAVTAARMGKRVLLVERNGYLGGAMAIGLSPLGFLDKHGNPCIGGFAQEFVDRLTREGYCLGTCVCPKHNSVTSINAEGVKLLAAQICREESIDVLLHCDILQTEVVSGEIRSITLFGKCNEIIVEAHRFIDCTGDGDLAYLAGCSYEMGQEDSGTLQPPTVMFTLEGVDQERLFQYIKAHPEELRYNDPAIYENPDYTVEHFQRNPSHVFVGLQGTFRRLMVQGKLPVQRESFIYINGTNPGEVYVNSIRLTNTDATDLMDVSRAELDGALQIPKLIELLKAQIPGFENCYLSSICPSLGVRESRRFLGIKRLTVSDALAASVPEDSVCLSGYKIDIHSGSDTGLYFRDIEEPYGIPYGCLVSAQISNLLFAGRCISTDPVIFGSLRVIPCCMAMGQAAATGAAVSLEDGVMPREASILKIRSELLKQGAILVPPIPQQERSIS